MLEVFFFLLSLSAAAVAPIYTSVSLQMEAKVTLVWTPTAASLAGEGGMLCQRAQPTLLLLLNIRAFLAACFSPDDARSLTRHGAFRLNT